jgi:hypothetical protein
MIASIVAQPRERHACHNADCLRMISLLCRTMVSEVFMQPSIQKRLSEAETSHNSFSWNILQGTSLLSRFYSEPMLVN